jgi:hypothetical protein
MIKSKPYKAIKKPANKSFASRDAGLNGIMDNDPRVQAANQLATVIPWLIKLLVILGLGWWAYSRFTNRFINLKLNSKYPLANVTDAQAKTRADAIAQSLALFDYTGNEFEVTSQNIAGLNYNGFIKVYNAFGKQSGHLGAGALNLVEWIHDQFSEYEIKQLSILLNGAFF